MLAPRRQLATAVWNPKSFISSAANPDFGNSLPPIAHKALIFGPGPCLTSPKHAVGIFSNNSCLIWRNYNSQTTKLLSSQAFFSAVVRRTYRSPQMKRTHEVTKDSDNAAGGLLTALKEENDAKRLKEEPQQEKEGEGSGSASVEEQQSQPPRRYPKKKAAVLLGYRGTNYVGMQRNPGVRTIEEELEKAIVLAGGIDAFNAGSYQKVNWQRCARTDKGVHAAMNCVSLKISYYSTQHSFCLQNPPGLEERINAHLPPDIRVFSVARTVGGFDSKNACDSRIYEYLLPSFVLAPIANKHGTSSSGSLVTESLLNQVNEYLAVFPGTRNFFNFTIRVDQTDPSAIRYLLNFKCEGPVVIDGVEFVRFIIQGQSFMLHQIRRMIGLSVYLLRQDLPKDIIEASFDRKMPVPTAPPDGLLLQQPVYKHYIENKGRLYPPLSWEAIKDQAEKFRAEEIYPHIAKIEKEAQVYKQWIEHLETLGLTDELNAVVQDWRDAPPEEKVKISEAPESNRPRRFRTNKAVEE